MDLSPEELREMMSLSGPRPFRLIDVREEDEFAICRLDQANFTVSHATYAPRVPLDWVEDDGFSRLVLFLE